MNSASNRFVLRGEMVDGCGFDRVETRKCSAALGNTITNQRLIGMSYPADWVEVQEDGVDQYILDHAKNRWSPADDAAHWY